MVDKAGIEATVAALCAAARKGEDASDAAVAEAVAACEASLSAWKEAGSRLPASEPTLQAANALLDALHAVNEEGLPFGVRTPGMEMQTLLDEAEEEGFAVEAPSSPAP